MKRSTFFLHLLGEIIALLLLSFAINVILNHFFEDTLSILIRNSILLALPFIFMVIYYDFRCRFKKLQANAATDSQHKIMKRSTFFLRSFGSHLILILIFSIIHDGLGLFIGYLDYNTFDLIITPIIIILPIKIYTIYTDYKKIFK